MTRYETFLRYIRTLIHAGKKKDYVFLIVKLSYFVRVGRMIQYILLLFKNVSISCIPTTVEILTLSSDVR
jgi:hypothetical protein